MFERFASSAALRRKSVLLGLLGVMLFGAPSCLGMLEIDDYASIPESVCELYDRCYGPEAFPGCRRHVSGQLETADPGVRADYLDTIVDCLDNCASVSDCLDQPLFCRSIHDACGADAQCCGASADTATCFGQTCCLRKGAPCQLDSDCCAGSCSGNGCTADPQPTCRPNGAACSAASECCSDNCSAGVCATPCLAVAAACGSNAECCSNTCTAGACADACGGIGTTCTVSTDCCSGICVAGACSNMCAVVGTTCTNDTDCCSGQCAAGLCRKNGCVASGDLCFSDLDCCDDACDKSRGICGSFGCFPDGTPCELDGSCCTNLCDPVDRRCSNRSCKKIGESCNADVDCCGAYCQGSTCQCGQAGTACTQAEAYKCCSRLCENDLCVDCRPVANACTTNDECCSGSCNGGLCCNFVGCAHDICTVGPPLSTNVCSPQTVGAAQASCIDQICADDPSCCCGFWSQACADKVATICNLTCP